MMRARWFETILVALLLAGGCSSTKSNPPNGGGSGGSGAAGKGGSTGGGRAGSGGSTGGGAGAQAGSGGSTGGGGSQAGSGGSTGGGGSQAGSGGSGGSPAGGGGSGGTGGGAADGAPADTDDEDLAPTPDGAGDAPPLGPAAPGQGPTAEGRIVFSQDFEQGMTGIERSPRGLPVDRAQIVDDPLRQRGKVMRVTWQAGDNFRTSAGTEPRSWISARPGHEFGVGKRLSHAFGFMTSSTDMGFAFGQVISTNGPVWMTLGDPDGTLTIFCRPCGGNTRHMKLEANRWYDFRIEMDYRVGGRIDFYVNGQMFTQRTIDSTRGTQAHWDGGIYNRPEGTRGNRTRTVYISNLSIGER